MQEFKLDVINAGRLSSDEQNEILGGNISCGKYIDCHADNLNSCKTYHNCNGVNDTQKKNCDKYYFATIFDDSTEISIGNVVPSF